MHTISRPIYITREGDQFQVKCYRGFVTAPIMKLFDDHASATAYATSKLRTKYYSRSCVLDETQKRAA